MKPEVKVEVKEVARTPLSRVEILGQRSVELSEGKFGGADASPVTRRQ